MIKYLIGLSILAVFLTSSANGFDYCHDHFDNGTPMCHKLPNTVANIVNISNATMSMNMSMTDVSK